MSMKPLWMSNAPWVGTGYGTQTGMILRKLWERGHDPSCFAFYGLSGNMIQYEGYDVYPGSGYEDWGNDVIKNHIEAAESDVVITLLDLFVLRPDVWESLPIPWAAWIPIDSVDIGYQTFELLKRCQVPIAMSHFGYAQMEEKGITPAGTIYHAVDTDTFKPMDKAEARELRGIPQDCYLIGMVMANKGDRKQYPIQMEAIKMWMDQNPDREIRVYIHTEPTNMMGGWDMRNLVAQLGLKGKVFASNQYHTSVIPSSPDIMASMYNCFDVLMNCSAGEGFGIPIVEAQACGVPVLTTGATAMPELTQYGYSIDVATKYLGAHHGWGFLPSLEDMVYRLECVYRMANSTDAQVGRQWVIDNCGLEKIVDEWEYVLEGIRQQVEDNKDAQQQLEIVS